MPGETSILQNAREGELLEAAREGDMSAFADLFEPLRPALVRVAASIVGEADSEDVVMDAMLKTWRGIPSFRESAKLRTWAIRIVRNTALDAVRRRKVKREVALDAPVYEDSDSVSMVDNIEDERAARPGEGLDAAVMRSGVAEALAKLKDHHRQALELRYLDDLSYQEIAVATGVSIGTVMSRLHYGKRRLEGFLKDFKRSFEGGNVK